MNFKYLNELKNCHLCPWDCGANRFDGERGVCRVGLPEVAYTNFTQVLKSYSITMLGCSFICTYCNAYRISQYPDSGWRYRGYVDPPALIEEIHHAFNSQYAQDMSVTKLSFTGGEPSIHTPYLEAVVGILNKEISQPDNQDISPLDVGLATNGFATRKTMERLCEISSYINFEIKAFDTELHQALTGAPSEPVLENAELLARKHPNKIRVFRTVVIPGINHEEILEIARFIQEIDPSIHYRLVGFRPHFMLYYHPAPTRSLMQKLVEECKKLGLENVDYSGYHPGGSQLTEQLNNNGVETLYHHLNQVGCYRKPRNCGECPENHHCPAVILEPWTNLPDD
jgi:pyruvate formate lyase activating enzyme